MEVVELNPFTVDAVSRVFGSYSGDPYHLPGVHAFVGEGRNHFSRSTTPCDVIEISQIDTFAASAAGAYALTENSLYTTEAIRMFWSHLSEQGVLSVSRWVNGPAWPESVRLVLLEVEALRQEGIVEPRNHMVVFAAGDTANVLLFRKPLTQAQMDRAVGIAARQGFAILWPAVPGYTDVSELTRALTDGPQAMTARGYDVSAPTDDRPFFFQTLNILSGTSRAAEVGTEREQSVTLLRRLVAILGGLVFVLVLLPVAARGALPRGPHFARSTVFFASLGLGFMFVEIPLLQRLTVYLGHPSYSTTVVLGSLLIGAGFGAWFAGHIPEARRRLVGLLVPLVVGALAFLLLWLIGRTIGQPFAVRVAISITALTLAGAMMGMPFPLGMANFDDRDRSWYWAVNGATSVLASVLALVIALISGFSAVLGCAIAAYLMAALTLPEGRRSDVDRGARPEQQQRQRQQRDLQAPGVTRRRIREPHVVPPLRQRDAADRMIGAIDRRRRAVHGRRPSRIERVGEQQEAVGRRLRVDRDVTRVLVRDDGPAWRGRSRQVDLVDGRMDRVGRVVQQDLAIGIEAGVEKTPGGLLIRDHVACRPHEPHARGARDAVDIRLSVVAGQLKRRALLRIRTEHVTHPIHLQEGGEGRMEPQRLRVVIVGGQLRDERRLPAVIAPDVHVPSRGDPRVAVRGRRAPESAAGVGLEEMADLEDTGRRPPTPRDLERATMKLPVPRRECPRLGRPGLNELYRRRWREPLASRDHRILPRLMDQEVECGRRRTAPARSPAESVTAVSSAAPDPRAAASARRRRAVRCRAPRR